MITALIVGVLILASVGLCMPAMAQKGDFRGPNATEVFDLRSRCAELAEKMLEENVISGGLTQSQISRYDLRTNRCYVEMTVQSNNGITYHHRQLYDGQTKELLAYSRMDKDGMAGVVVDKQHTATKSDD